MASQSYGELSTKLKSGKNRIKVRSHFILRSEAAQAMGILRFFFEIQKKLQQYAFLFVPCFRRAKLTVVPD